MSPTILDVPTTVDINGENGLPTPPDDDQLHYLSPPPGDLSDRLGRENGTPWAMRSGASQSSLTASDDPPELSDAFNMESDRLTGGLGVYHGGHPSNRNSPTLSQDQEVDFSRTSSCPISWNDSYYRDLRSKDVDGLSPSGSDNWAESGSNLASPSYSNASSEHTNETGRKTFTTAAEEFGTESAAASP